MEFSKRRREEENKYRFQKTVDIDLHIIANECFVKTEVVQTFQNSTDKAMELKICITKMNNYLFDSFAAKIGNSQNVFSKVIEKEKGETKYSDSLASGNVGIFVEERDEDEIYIVHLGNIPPKENIIFASYYISSIEFSQKGYEFELMRNLPIFYEFPDDRSIPKSIKGDIIIKTSSKITKFEKKSIKNSVNYKDEKKSGKEASLKFEVNLIYKEELRKFLQRQSDMHDRHGMHDMHDFHDWEYEEFLRRSNRKDANGFDFNPISYYEEPIQYLKENAFINSEKIVFHTEESKNVFVQEHQKYNDEIILNFNMTSPTESKSKKEGLELPSIFIFLIDESGSMYGKSIDLVKDSLKLFLQSLPDKSYYQLVGFGTNFEKYNKIPVLYTEENVKESFNLIDKKISSERGGTNIYSPLKSIYDDIGEYNKLNLPKNIIILTDGEIDNKNKTLNLIQSNVSNFTIYSIGLGDNFDEDLIKNCGIIGKGKYSLVKDLEKLNETVIDIIEDCSETYITMKNIKMNINGKDITDKNWNILYKNLITFDKVMKNNQLIDCSILLKIPDKFNSKMIKDVKVNLNYLDFNGNEKSIDLTFNNKINLLSKGDELFKLLINKQLQAEKENRLEISKKYQIICEESCLFAEIELDEKINKKMEKIELSDKNMKETSNGTIIVNKPKPEPEPVPSTANVAPGPKRKKKGAHIGKECYIAESVIKEREFKIKVIEAIRTQNIIKGYWEKNDKTNCILEKYKKEFDLVVQKVNDENIATTFIMVYFFEKELKEKLKEYRIIIKKAKKYIMSVVNKSYEELKKDLNIYN